nr:RNA chaperone Hfq [Paraburkholderia fynbosensis]
MTGRPSVQDDFLQMFLNDRSTENVFLVNGVRLGGQLVAFDQFAGRCHVDDFRAKRCR